MLAASSSHALPPRRGALGTSVLLALRSRLLTPAAALTGRALLARAALAGLALCAVEIVLGAVAAPSWVVPESRASFAPWISGPLHALGTHALSQGALTTLMLVMFACYLLVLALVSSLTLRALAITIVGISALLVLSPPLLLTDVFNYIAYARLGGLHHINPYLHGAIAAPQDPILQFDSWRYLRSPYGPLFTLASYALAPLSLADSVWVIKLTAVLPFLASLALLALCARRLGRSPVPAVALLGLNPLVLIYGVGGDHNDFIMLALVLAAIAWTLGDRAPRGAVAAVAAAGVKATAALLLPFMILGSSRRRRTLIAALLAGALLVAGTLLIVGSAVVPALAVQASCVSQFSFPDLTGRALGLGGATTAVHIGFVVLLVVVFVWQIARTRPGNWITPAGWTTLALLAGLTWMIPWYVGWLLPLAALSPSRRLKGAALIASTYALLVWLPPISNTLKTVLPLPANSTTLGCLHKANVVAPKIPDNWVPGQLSASLPAPRASSRPV